MQAQRANRVGIAWVAGMGLLFAIRPQLADWVQCVADGGGFCAELARRWYMVILLSPFPFIAFHCMEWLYLRSHSTDGLEENPWMARGTRGLEGDQRLHRSQIISCFGALYAICLSIYWIVFATIADL